MRKFAHILANETDEDFIYAFLEQLFTKDEIHMIEQRFKIMELIKRGIPQHTIAKQINASLCSITRGAKMLKQKDSAASVVIEKYFINNSEK